MTELWTCIYVWFPLCQQCSKVLDDLLWLWSSKTAFLDNIGIEINGHVDNYHHVFTAMWNLLTGVL